jgi:GTP-binding protein Era
VAVEVDSFQEKPDQAVISAIIYVERDSQKGILIGKGGSMIKQIGTEARQELIEMLGTKVHLDLRVKVLKNWRSNEELMRRLGYRIARE